MKVKELIKLLQIFDEDRLVLVNGWEDGYDQPASISANAVVLDPTESWNGEYRIAEPYDLGIIEAVIISRP